MTESVKPVPEGYRTVTPSMIVRDAARALEFYKKALGATVLGVSHGPGGKVVHAAMRIGDSMVMLNDEFPDWGALSPLSQGGGRSISLHLYVENADAQFQRAVDAGATVAMPMMDAFWGDRYGQVIDPFGHRWSFGTRKKNLTPEEMEVAQREAFANMAEGKKP